MPELQIDNPLSVSVYASALESDTFANLCVLCGARILVLAAMPDFGAGKGSEQER